MGRNFHASWLPCIPLRKRDLPKLTGYSLSSLATAVDAPSISRAALAALKARRDRKILEWEMALKVQAAWRGRAAKMMVMTMRLLRVSRIQPPACLSRKTGVSQLVPAAELMVTTMLMLRASYFSMPLYVAHPVRDKACPSPS